MQKSTSCLQAVSLIYGDPGPSRTKNRLVAGVAQLRNQNVVMRPGKKRKCADLPRLGNDVGRANAAVVDGARQHRAVSSDTVVRSLPKRAPLVYVCVYRQVPPKAPSAWNALNDAAALHEDLAELLKQYKTGRTVYDRGDDPSFFSAEYHDGRAELAGWGVCRPNVREKLYPGDVVVYFCARRSAGAENTDYFFAGLGTVGVRVEGRRREIWRDNGSADLQRLRKHLNVLVMYDKRGQCLRHERFPPGHPQDWGTRSDAPYILFDPAQSKFNMRKPLHVAVAQKGASNEVWIEDGGTRIANLRAVLFDEPGVTRDLRTSYRGTAHPHINLTSKLAAAGISLGAFRDRLLALV